MNAHINAASITCACITVTWTDTPKDLFWGAIASPDTVEQRQKIGEMHRGVVWILSCVLCLGYSDQDLLTATIDNPSSLFPASLGF